jgi:quercetin dioxygenase-like cupin family protein
MTARSRLVLSLSAVFFLANAAYAQELPLRLTPGEIANLGHQGAGAGTSGVVGIQSTVLSGDPTKAGPYTIEIRVPAHTRIAAHGHRDDRSAVVVSGEWYLGYGSTAAETAVKSLPPGSFYTEPAGEAHFAMTRNQPAVVYITGVGPTSTTYTDPATAPRP